MDDLGVTDILDRHLEDNVGTKTNNTAERRKALRMLELVNVDVWNDRNWHFRIKHAPFTISGAASPAGTFDITLDDFVSIGPPGGMFITGYVDPLTEMPLRDYIRLHNGLAQTGRPLGFVPLGVSSSVRTFGSYPHATVNTPGTLAYFASAPTLTDANPGGIDVYPIEWRQLVLMEGLLYHYMKSKANIQSVNEQWRLYQSGLRKMRAEERGGRSETHRLVPFRVRGGRRR